MWTTILWNVLRWKLSSGLLEVVYELVLEVDDDDLDGADKWRAVWAGLRQDERVRDTVNNRGRWLINLAIEAAVARLRG